MIMNQAQFLTNSMRLIHNYLNFKCDMKILQKLSINSIQQALISKIIYGYPLEASSSFTNSRTI